MIRVYHVGAWGRNHGDRAIQTAMSDIITQVAAQQYHDVAHIYPIDIQTGPFTQYVAEVRDKADLLVVGGGGLLWDKPELGSRSGWQWDITLDEFEALDGVPTVLYGLGWTQFPYGDPTGEDGRLGEHLRGLLLRGVHLWARNDGTRTTLGRMGIGSSYGPDMAVFASGIPSPDADWLRTMKSPRVGIVWASDKPEWRWPNPQQHDRYIWALASALKYVGANVTLIEHIAGMDLEILLDLRRRLPNVESVEERHSLLYPATRINVRRLIGLYHHFDVILSMRKHGLLLAMAQGVPAIGLGDMPEVSWFCSDYGLPWFPSSGNTTPDTLHHTLATALDPEWRLSHIEDKRSRLTEDRKRTEATVAKILSMARRRAVA